MTKAQEEKISLCGDATFSIEPNDAIAKDPTSGTMVEVPIG